MKAFARLSLAVLSLAPLIAIDSFANQCYQSHIKTDAPSAYEVETQLKAAAINARLSPEMLKTTAHGSDQYILRSFEKEGLFYEEIALWFPNVRKGVTAKIQAKLLKEQASTQKVKMLHFWLKNAELSQFAPVWARANWNGIKNINKRWQILSQLPNFFQALTLKSQSELFEYNILDFNDVVRSDKTDQLITVGDDLGSYEMRLTKAIPNRAEFQGLRDATEQYLEGKVGHQHLFHAWPKEQNQRKEMAPYYIELLDSSSWYLYWRQMNRNPEFVDSILVHPFLGVYSTPHLKTLYRAVLENDPESFKSKYNMVGARAFAPLKEDPNGQWTPDWELRSGNKGKMRSFIENTIEARLVSGDYSGLKDFRQNSGFNTVIKTAEAAKSFVNANELGILTKFEETLPEMTSAHMEVAKTHYRKRILAPLLPWASRLNIDHKKNLLRAAQKEYAAGMVKVARSYLGKISRADATKEDRQEAREDALSELEVLNFEFARKTRLDQDFEKYLRITPTELPSPLVESTGPININAVGLGIEYSVRFPIEMKPQVQSQASKLISDFAKDLGNEFEANQVPAPVGQGDSHGHGLVVKYTIKDQSQQTWRVEWDGIARSYKDGKVANAWGGHIEIVSPKFAPVTLEDGPVQVLYRTARENGMIPNRAAGGAHVNFDLGFLKQLPKEQASKAVVNLIRYFESNQAMAMALWTHPARVHAAHPVQLKPGFAEALANFSGDLKDLGRLLYDYKYFNTYVGRKPKYVPLNLTALMSEIVPREYIDRTLDIKNPQSQWFPNFAKVTDRGEARFFDAPMDEAMAALQIKYWRAVLDETFNARTLLPMERKYSDAEIKSWKTDPFAWQKATDEHFRSLGLDPAEFKRLVWDSFVIQSTEQPAVKNYTEYPNFLPSEKK